MQCALKWSVFLKSALTMTFWPYFAFLHSTSTVPVCFLDKGSISGWGVISSRPERNQSPYLLTRAKILIEFLTPPSSTQIRQRIILVFCLCFLHPVFIFPYMALPFPSKVESIKCSQNEIPPFSLFSLSSSVTLTNLHIWRPSRKA